MKNGQPTTSAIRHPGLGGMASPVSVMCFFGKEIVPSSASLLDENTLKEPAKASPKTEMLKFSGAASTRTFPGNSLTVFRFAAFGKKK